MPFPLIPVIGATAVFGALLASKSRNDAPLDPKVEASRRYIYNDAMTSKDMSIEKLRSLSAVFASQGMTAEAHMLSQRANLRESNKLNPALRAARYEALQKAFASTDIAGIRHMADIHQEMGALGAAAGLREYAAGLEAKGNNPPERLPDEETAQ